MGWLDSPHRHWLEYSPCFKSSWLQAHAVKALICKCPALEKFCTPMYTNVIYRCKAPLSSSILFHSIGMWHSSCLLTTVSFASWQSHPLMQSCSQWQIAATNSSSCKARMYIAAHLAFLGSATSGLLEEGPAVEPPLRIKRSSSSVRAFTFMIWKNLASRLQAQIRD